MRSMFGIYFLASVFLDMTLSSAVDSSNRKGKLFSNLFGVLGHADCTTGAEDGNNSGICYNEVECLVKGGKFSGYCGPPAVTGVCCVFLVNKCDAVITERVTHFTNPAFPFQDTRPNSCLIKIKPQKDTCWVRFDMIEFELDADIDGKCLTDSMTVINSEGGSGGQICGVKSGFTYVAKGPRENEELGLAVLLQSARFKWNIKISYISCDKVENIPVYDKCGETGATASNFTRLLSSSNKKGRKVVKQKRARISNALEALCKDNDDEDSIACELAYSLSKSKSRLQTRRIDDKEENGKNRDALLRKKFASSEPYRPAFTTRDVFCQSKFRKEAEVTAGGPSSKIIDGTEAPLHAFPWIVSLQYRNMHFCGGSLITAHFVMTAAHCMDFGKLSDFLPNLTIRLGDHNLNSTTETDSEVRKAARVFLYWQFNNKPGTQGDFALIKLDSPISFTRAISPVCLPEDPSQNFAKTVAVTAGWGLTEAGNLSEVLRQAELNIIPNNTCVDALGPVNLPITADMICTFHGPLGTETICQGDSGGPLMVRDAKDRFVVVGLTSFSVTDCMAPFPAVFSRVSYFLNWTAAVISSEM